MVKIHLLLGRGNHWLFKQLNSLGIVETERQLNSLQDCLYEQAKNTNDGFKGLMEILSSKLTIISAINKIKSNKGAMTRV